MSLFTNHTIASAPEDSREVLQGAQNTLGFIPNLYAKLAESPAALNAYKSLASFFEKSSLSPTEQQVVLLTVSVANGCEFCVAAHSMIAKQMVGVDEAVVTAIRDQVTIADSQLQALAAFTREAVEARGWVNGGPVEEFIAAGYTKEQAVDVILGVSMKTLSNYANHLTGTTTNEEFSSEAWQRP
jgi:uncharacterized peroxidase-related enzyme